MRGSEIPVNKGGEDPRGAKLAHAVPATVAIAPAWVRGVGRFCRAIPMVPGKGIFTRRVLSGFLRGRGHVVIVPLRSPGGGQLICHLDDWIPWVVFLHGRYRVEMPYEEFMLSQVTPGMTIVEIGANIGYYAVQFGRLLRDRGKLHAFEPVQRQFDILRAQIDLNGLGTVVLNRRIVSDTGGTKRIYLTEPGNTGSSSVELTGEQFEEVEAVTLDDYALRAGLDMIDLVKIDVEGHELSVLGGMKGLLAGGKIDRVFVEVNSRALPGGEEGARRLVDFLSGYGYRPSSIRRGRPEPYPAPRDESLVLFRR